jgi:hypothetical protein
MAPRPLPNLDRFYLLTFVASLMATTYCGPLALAAWLLAVVWLTGLTRLSHSGQSKKRKRTCNSKGGCL